MFGKPFMLDNMVGLPPLKFRYRVRSCPFRLTSSVGWFHTNCISFFLLVPRFYSPFLGVELWLERGLSIKDDVYLFDYSQTLQSVQVPPLTHPLFFLPPSLSLLLCTPPLLRQFPLFWYKKFSSSFNSPNVSWWLVPCESEQKFCNFFLKWL